jgi:hypothetical protein
MLTIWVSRPKTIKKMISDNDPNAFWLDPRFEDNPAFLADEAEELLKGTTQSEGGSIHKASHFTSVTTSTIS